MAVLNSVLACAVLLSPVLAWKESCEALRYHSDLVDTVATTYYAPGDLVNITNLASSISTTELPGFCRAQIIVHTNRETGNFANTEVWLPDEWNERFYGAGNGGFNGGVIVSDLGFSAVSRGFAGMSTNAGHNSTAFDLSWALNNPEAVTDNGYRAIQLSTVAGKQIVKAYYGREAKTNIWNACSTGGRQGLLFAQRFTDYYDGIVVGSPAAWVTHLEGRNIHIALINGTDEYVAPDSWSTLQEAVLAQCDKLDGVEDGVITNPTACSKIFDFSAVACGAKQTAGCYTPAQIEAIRTRLYADYVEDGFFVTPGFNFGSEGEFRTTVGTSYDQGLAAGPYFKFAFYNDPNWPSSSVTIDDIRDLAEANPGMVDAVDPDLREFQKNGGKLIQYVGLSDAFVTAGLSNYYRQSVEDFYAAQGAKDELDSFYKFFEVPGMGHCRGGNGVHAFGNAGQNAAGLVPIENSPKYDIVAAMVAWVEEGRKPEKIIAAHYQDNNATLGIEFTRPLCPWPTRATYDGKGDVDSADSFSCA